MIDHGYVEGQGVQFVVAWTDDGVAATVQEPVTLRVKLAGSATELPAIVMTGLGGGRYEATTTFPDPGVYDLRVESSGPAPGVIEDQVRIRPSSFV